MYLFFYCVVVDLAQAVQSLCRGVVDANVKSVLDSIATDVDASIISTTAVKLYARNLDVDVANYMKLRELEGELENII